MQIILTEQEYNELKERAKTGVTKGDILDAASALAKECFQAGTQHYGLENPVASVRGPFEKFRKAVGLNLS